MGNVKLEAIVYRYKKKTHLVGVTKFAVFSRSNDRTNEIMASDTELPIKFVVVSDVNWKAKGMGPFR